MNDLMKSYTSRKRSAAAMAKHAKARALKVVAIQEPLAMISEDAGIVKARRNGSRLG
jgi:hypothetical protein